ncbi:MAG: hypothetical protein ABIZ57_11450, partial [Candidatus Limnocylindria bacterium]
PTIWVQSLNATTALSKSTWTATVTVKVIGADGSGVPNATVSTTWSAGSPDTCTTGSAGTCAVTSDNLNKRKVASVNLTVSGVTHATLVWDQTRGQNTLNVARPG